MSFAWASAPTFRIPPRRSSIPALRLRATSCAAATSYSSGPAVSACRMSASISARGASSMPRAAARRSASAACPSTTGRAALPERDGPMCWSNTRATASSAAAEPAPRLPLAGLPPVARLAGRHARSGADGKKQSLPVQRDPISASMSSGSLGAAAEMTSGSPLVTTTSSSMRMPMPRQRAGTPFMSRPM